MSRIAWLITAATLRSQPMVTWGRVAGFRSVQKPEENSIPTMEAIKRASENFFEGLRALNDGDLDLAEMKFLKALELAPGRPSVLTNLSVVYARQNKLVEALELVSKALEKDSSEPLHWLQKGAVQLKLGDHDGALSSLMRALEKNPSLAEAHLNLGAALKELNRLDEALASYDSAISLKPDYAEAYSNRGVVLKELDRLEEALVSCDKAIGLKPGYAEAHSNRGVVLKELDRPDEALASYGNAISLKPDHAEAHSNQGNVLKELGRLEEALASYDKAIALRPGYAEAYTNRGNALEALGRLDEALVSHDMAISLKPDYAEAHSNRGNVLKALNRLDEALASYDRAISLRPESPGAKYSKSSLLLQQGSLLEGFELQLSRWHAEEFRHQAPNTTVPLWDGRPTDGNVLLWAEQGIGDEVFYASMLSLLDTGKQRISLSADKRLHSIYARSFPHLELVDRKLTKTSFSTEFTAQAPIGNIGYLLKVSQDRLKEREYPYLKADPVRRSQLRQSHYPDGGTRVCGIAWKSGNKQLGRPRTIDLSGFSPLWACEGMDFVNLQYGDVGEEIALVKERFGREIKVIPEVDVYNDIEGLLALIDMCDVVFTIDNVTAHLAGAVGKKSVVLVPTGVGRYWYWGGESPSRWYPSLNLVYQKQVGDWTEAIEDAVRIARQIIST